MEFPNSTTLPSQMGANGSPLTDFPTTSVQDTSACLWTPATVNSADTLGATSTRAPTARAVPSQRLLLTRETKRRSPLHGVRCTQPRALAAPTRQAPAR